jgi:hypothetical protein
MFFIQTLNDFPVSFAIDVVDPTMVRARHAIDVRLIAGVERGGIASSTRRTNAIPGSRPPATEVAWRRRWIRGKQSERHPASEDFAFHRDDLLRSGVIVDAEWAEFHCYGFVFRGRGVHTGW